MAFIPANSFSLVNSLISYSPFSVCFQDRPASPAPFKQITAFKLLKNLTLANLIVSPILLVSLIPCFSTQLFTGEYSPCKANSYKAQP